MQQEVILELDLSSLRQAIGGGSYVRGAEYARQQAVTHATWDPEDNALCGAVQGQYGRSYDVAAYFSLPAGRPARFSTGECSCPVGYNCKHVVALVLSALTSDTPDPSGPRAPRPAAWQQSLDSLLTSPGSECAGTAALAIELALAAGLGQAARTGPSPLRLTARLVRPGKNGGWIAGDLSWGRLDALSYAGDYNAQQVRLLRELHGLYQASAGNDGYYGYRYGDEKSIELSSVGSRQLWPLLDEARAAGLQLVYPGKRGVLDGYQEAGFCLDVTRGQAGGLEIVPVIRGGDGEPVVPVAFIGAEGHGAVYIDRAQAAAGGDPRSWRFGLARLGRPVPPALQRMALGSERLEVPAAEEPGFLERYYPRLRQAADLISSDGSFTPPSISGPDLVLRAGYGAGHELDVSWEWAYQVGESPQRVPPRTRAPA